MRNHKQDWSCATNSSGGDVERISNIDEFRVGLECHQVYMTQWTHHDSYDMSVKLKLVEWTRTEVIFKLSSLVIFVFLFGQYNVNN